MLRGEAAMRAFYHNVGIRPETTKLAIQARRKQPLQAERSAAVRKRADAYRTAGGHRPDRDKWWSSSMANIIPFLSGSAFGPQDIQAMSKALDEVCAALGVPDGDNTIRRVVAERIVSLATRGDCDAVRLRDRVIRECSGGNASARANRIGVQRTRTTIMPVWLEKKRAFK
jgi:hypothetical protein